MAGRWLCAAAALALAGCSSGGGGSSGGGTTGGTAPTPTPTPTVTPTPVPTPTPTPATPWTNFVSATFDRMFEQDPAFAVWEGRHEFDGKLTDWSDTALRAQDDFFHTAITQAQAFTGLSANEAFERDYLIQVLQGQIFWFEDVDQPHTNPTFYINDGLDPEVYILRNYADPLTRMRAVTKFLQGIPAAAAMIRTNLRFPMSTPLISNGVNSFDGFGTYYESDIPAAFVGIGTAADQTALTQAAATAGQTMHDLAQWLATHFADATSTIAMGGPAFLKMLQTNEAVNTTVDQLEAAGEADLQRNQNALAAACAIYAPGLSNANCVGRMESNRPADGVLAAATRQITELRNFVTAQDLMTIPSNDAVEVRQSPAFNNGTFFATTGPYDRNVAAIYYTSASQQIGEADLLFVTAHEVMPGHFQQFLHSNRAPSMTGQLLVTYGFAEGWAHYSEEMMWEAGLRGTAEAHIGQIFNALLRDCRFLAGVGIHARGMTLTDAATLFQTQCYQTASSASGQARRGVYDPMYVNYLLGKMMIRKLRDDWTATRGGRTAWKAFHDQFLSYGGPPIPLVRQAMMGEATPRTVF